MYVNWPTSIAADFVLTPTHTVTIFSSSDTVSRPDCEDTYFFSNIHCTVYFRVVLFKEW